MRALQVEQPTRGIRNVPGPEDRPVHVGGHRAWGRVRRLQFPQPFVAAPPRQTDTGRAGRSPACCDQRETLAEAKRNL